MVADAHGIEESTGRKWRRDRRELGNERRTRRQKAELLGHKLGRKWTLPDSLLSRMVSPLNPVRTEGLHN
jgi:hypothetical protein